MMRKEWTTLKQQMEMTMQVNLGHLSRSAEALGRAAHTVSEAMLKLALDLRQIPFKYCERCGHLLGEKHDHEGDWVYSACLCERCGHENAYWHKADTNPQVKNCAACGASEAITGGLLMGVPECMQEDCIGNIRGEGSE